MGQLLPAFLRREPLLPAYLSYQLSVLLLGSDGPSSAVVETGPIHHGDAESTEDARRGWNRG